MEDEKIHFLKMHVCSQDLDDDTLRDIAEQAELVRYEPGDEIHRARDVLTNVYLIVQGRVKCAAMNVHGRVFMERIYSRGQQLGGL